MKKEEPYGAGMGMTRTIRGKRVNLSAMTSKINDALQLIEDLDKRRIELEHAKPTPENSQALLELAIEYETHKMPKIARAIRLQVSRR